MSSGTAISSYHRAERHFQSGEFGFAQVAYIEVLESHARGDAPRLVVLSAMQRLAEIAALFGAWDVALEHLESARRAFMRTGNTYMADYVATRIAAVLNARGAGRAASVLLEALVGRPPHPWSGTSDDLSGWEDRWIWSQVSTADRAVFFSRYYLEAGQVEAYWGRFERATVLLRRGFDCARVTDEASRATTRLCLMLASCYLQWGNLPSASVSLDLIAVDPDERTQPGDVVFQLEVKGRLALLSGSLGSAKASFERALEVCARLHADAAWQTAALNLSQVLVLLNQSNEARRLCEEVLARARDAGNRAIEVRASYIESFSDDRTRSLAGGISLAPSVSEMWLGDHREISRADAARQPTPFDIEESADYLTLFEERALGFFWHLSRGSLDAAAAYLDELERIFLGAQPSTDSLLIRVRLHTLACMLSYYQAQYADALAGFRAACATLRRLGLKPELWQALRFLQWTLIRSGSTSEANEVGRESARVLSALTDSLAGTDLVLFLLNKWTTAELYMAGEIQTLIDLKRGLARGGWPRIFARPWRRLAICRRLVRLLDYADRYKAAVFEHSPDDESPAAPPPTRPRWFLRLIWHPRTSTTVGWIVLPDLTLVARARWLSLDFGVSGVTKLQVRSWVKQWHEAVRDQEPTKGIAAIRQLGVALQVDEIVRTLPRRVRSLVCVPDDILHGVPFAALRYDEAADGTGFYLGQTYSVSVSFDWWPRPNWKRASPAALVVGVPYGSGAFDPLPHAAAEACAVGDRLRERGMPVKTPTSRAEILAELPDVTHFHIACHGSFEPDRPDRSGLVLVSQVRQVEMLTVRDMARLDLHKMEQVVLSGCWAADSYILPGRWIVSVPSVLCRRGARVVVASLWPVDDRVAHHFFLRLYDGAPRISPAERLFLVRREFIDRIGAGANEQFDDPFFWAGVQVYSGG